MHKKRPRPHHRPTADLGTPASAQETHWADVADWYDTLVGDEGSEYHQHVIIPGVLRLLNLQENTKHKTQNAKLPTEISKLETRNTKLHILDLACGQGVVSRKLAQLGCDVVGLDAAAPLIDAARRRNESDGLPIEYSVADATKLVGQENQTRLGLKPAAFDAVTLILAIQNITPLSPVWQACRELLKPGGSLIIVMMHPCFRNPKQSDWLWQEAGGGVQSRLIRQYLSSTQVDIQTHPGLAAHGKDSASTPHFHRPLQAYINTLGNAGLLIDHIAEWISHKSSQAGPRKEALDRARKEIPMFLALRARKA